MILTGSEIKKEIKAGNISISDYDENQVNPNSYNLRLADELIVYTADELDMKKQNETRTFKIPPEGYVLEPGKLYLGRTYERVQTDRFASKIDGRSSVGRLGIFVHVTAGFIDIGWDGYLTFEIHVIKPIRVYPMVKISQISFYEVKGDRSITYKNAGKYYGNHGTQASMLFKDFEITSNSWVKTDKESKEDSCAKTACNTKVKCCKSKTKK